MNNKCCWTVFISIDLEEWEHVTCMKTVALKSQETVSGLKGYVAVGTCLMQGEEVTCRGRVSLYLHASVNTRDRCTNCGSALIYFHK